MAQLRGQIKAPKKKKNPTQLRNEEIANLSDAQSKTLAMMMLKELVEYGCKIEGKNEIKENIQGTNSSGKENQDSDQWFGAEGRKKHSTRKE